MRAATLDFVRERTNVVFVGPSGVGKTHLANALGQLACVAGYRVRFVLAADLVNDLVASQTTQHPAASGSPPGPLPTSCSSTSWGISSFDARGADLLYQVFNKRYQRASTVVTTNLALQGLGQAVPQLRRRHRHRRPARPQGPARQHRRQVTPQRSGGHVMR